MKPHIKLASLDASAATIATAFYGVPNIVAQWQPRIPVPLVPVVPGHRHAGPVTIDSRVPCPTVELVIVIRLHQDELWPHSKRAQSPPLAYGKCTERVQPLEVVRHSPVLQCSQVVIICQAPIWSLLFTATCRRPLRVIRARCNICDCCVRCVCWRTRNSNSP